MIIIKSEADLDGMRASGRVAAKVRDFLQRHSGARIADDWVTLYEPGLIRDRGRLQGLLDEVVAMGRLLRGEGTDGWEDSSWTTSDPGMTAAPLATSPERTDAPNPYAPPQPRPPSDMATGGLPAPLRHPLLPGPLPGRVRGRRSDRTHRCMVGAPR